MKVCRGVPALPPPPPTTEIQTYTGTVLDPMNPDPALIDIRDIAHALSMQCRFSGHLSLFYSVAEHSVRVSDILLEAQREDWAFYGLMHDASEAYLQDMASPLKHDSVLGARYRDAERPLMSAIGVRFGLPEGFGNHPAVKAVDKRMLVTERRDLLQGTKSLTSEQIALWEPWIGDVEPYEHQLRPYRRESAERMFMDRFKNLGGIE